MLMNQVAGPQVDVEDARVSLQLQQIADDRKHPYAKRITPLREGSRQMPMRLRSRNGRAGRDGKRYRRRSDRGSEPPRGAESVRTRSRRGHGNHTWFLNEEPEKGLLVDLCC